MNDEREKESEWRERERVRDEKKFKSLNHLKEQLQKDKKHIDQFLD